MIILLLFRPSVIRGPWLSLQLSCILYMIYTEYAALNTGIRGIAFFSGVAVLNLNSCNFLNYVKFA